MRRIICIFFVLSIGFTMWTPAGTRAEIIDRIVASVNGDIITLRELENRLDPFLKTNNVSNPDDIKMVKKMLVETMIQQILVIQEGERLGFDVKDQEVNEFVERVMTEKGLSRAQLDMELSKRGMSLTAFKTEIRAELMKKKIIQWELALFIVVTDDEVDQFVASGGTADAGTTQTGAGPKVALRAIILNLPDQASPDIVEKKERQAGEIIEQIKNGLDFASAATRYSEAESARQGGDIGEMSIAEASGEVRKAIESLNEGEISQPVRLGSTITIFQVVKFVTKNDRKETASTNGGADGTLSKEEREKIRQTLMNKKLEKRYESWLKEAHSKAIIKIDI